MNRKLVIPDEVVMNKIYLIRGQKVMIDSDLAELYNVGTKVLNQTVKRNLLRFPADFMFQLSAREYRNLRSQFVTSSWGGRRAFPFVFTEQGVAMLSSILNSERAILVNIHIVRVFMRMREIVMTNKGILLKVSQLEKKVTKQGGDIRLIFDYLTELLNPKKQVLRKIGFRRKDEANARMV
jgi:hypothetical protein